jgi:hypothetical protein
LSGTPVLVSFGKLRPRTTVPPPVGRRLEVGVGFEVCEAFRVTEDVLGTVGVPDCGAVDEALGVELMGGATAPALKFTSMKSFEDL